jgi:Family of unknown function (DUF6232)
LIDIYKAIKSYFQIYQLSKFLLWKINMNSVPYYDRDGIRITKGIFELPDGKQYIIKNINSVDIRQLKPSRKNPLICIVVGFFLIAAYGLGLLIIGLGIWLWRSQKTSYLIFLKTSSGENDACSSYDYEKIKEIRSALNAAIEAN